MPDMEEAVAFMETIDEVGPNQLTKCPEWTAHELVAHIAAGADEILRNVSAFNAGGAEAVPATRDLEEREAPFHQMGFAELCSAVGDNHAKMMAAINQAMALDPAAVTPWVGRQMPIAAFVTHARSEYALHRWDLVGDDETSARLLGQPDLTAHAVQALGAALVSRGAMAGADGDIRLTSPGQPDVAVTGAGVAFANDASGVGKAPAIEADVAARLLLLWGRNPDQPGRVQATNGAAQLQTMRQLLAGY